MLDLIKTNLTREAVEEISRARNEPKWLAEKRIENFSHFENLPEPDFIYGLSISLDRSEIDLNEINPLGKQNKIEFTANDKIIIKGLHEALKTHEEIIKKHFLPAQPKSKFDALVSAFWSEGLFIYVPKNTEVEIPIEIFSQLTSQTSIQTILIIAESFSKISIIQMNGSSVKEKSYSLQSIEVIGKESSKVNFISLQNFQQENAINFSSRKAQAERDALINFNICDFGGSFTKSDVETRLIGQGASANNLGIFLGNGNQQFDFSANSIHLAPNTSSEMSAKGALLGKSKAVYGGLIKITSDAPKSSGYQKQDILLLSPQAEAAPIPNMEIETNDVKKCGHGVTVGQVDKEKLFYLMSRGLSEKDAIKTIVEGLLEPAISQIKSEKIQIQLRELIMEKLK